MQLSWPGSLLAAQALCERQVLERALLVAGLTERAQRGGVVAQSAVGEAEVVVDDARTRIEPQRGFVGFHRGAILMAEEEREAEIVPAFDAIARGRHRAPVERGRFRRAVLLVVEHAERGQRGRVARVELERDL